MTEKAAVTAKSNASLGPGAAVAVTFKYEPIAGDDVASIIGGSKVLYMAGIARYTDVFNRRHLHSYCYQVAVDETSSTVNPGLVSCAHGNESN